MATTLLDYKNAVLAKGFEAVTTAPAITAAINAARRRIVNARRWTFLEAEDTSLVTAYGVATVAVSSAWRIDAVRASQSGSTRELEYRTPQEIRRLALQDSLPGTPYYWSKRAGNIIFYPVPDGVFALTVDYVKETVPALVADGDVETVLEDTMVDCVAWAAVRTLSFLMRDYNAVSFADSEYQTLIAAAIRDDNTPQRQSARQVTQNPNRFEDR